MFSRLTLWSPSTIVRKLRKLAVAAWMRVPDGLALLVVAIAAVSVVLDFSWSGLRPYVPWLPYWPDSHGVPAIVAIAAVVAGAPLVYRTGRSMLRPILLLVVITASILVTMKLPAVLAQSAGGLRSILHIALALVLGYLLSKLALLHRFSAFHGAQVVRRADELERLLPFQKEDLEKLRQAVLTGRVHDGARVVQLVGRWGEGKSFLIERFGAYMEHGRENGTEPTCDPCAVILIDVWEQQNEPNLHLAIVEQILGHKRYWYPYGWLLYPLSLCLAWLKKEATLAISAGSKMNAKVELPVSLPRPTGKRTLERLVARVRDKGCRTVVVLDEIDRATPQIAQAAITLARRSLNLPGVIVVLAYVDELIRYKAFNPLVDCLPDLGSTMRAVIFASGPDQGGPGTPGGVLSTVGDGSLANWQAWVDADKIALPSGGSGTAAAVGDGQWSPTDQDSRRLSDAVRLGFAYADRHRRQRLQARSSEKYLGSRPIHIQHLKVRDVPSMVVDFDTLAYLVTALVGDDVRQFAPQSDRLTSSDAAMRDRVIKAIEDAFRFYQEDGANVSSPPPLRMLEGELFSRLSGVQLKDSPLTRVSPQFVAAVALAAFDAAALHNL